MIMKVGAQRPMKMPRRSAFAAFFSLRIAQAPMLTAMETSAAP
jgi:hypothetical protein